VPLALLMPQPAMNRSFLLLFFKKEALSQGSPNTAAGRRAIKHML
jgi:hypothetical protein